MTLIVALTDDELHIEYKGIITVDNNMDSSYGHHLAQGVSDNC